MLKIVADDADRDDLAGTLDGLVAEGARRMLMAGLEAEVADYIERNSDAWTNSIASPLGRAARVAAGQMNALVGVIVESRTGEPS